MPSSGISSGKRISLHVQLNCCGQRNYKSDKKAKRQMICMDCWDTSGKERHGKHLVPVCYCFSSELKDADPRASMRKKIGVVADWAILTKL